MLNSYISPFFVLAFVGLQAERKQTIEQLETRLQALQEEVSQNSLDEFALDTNCGVLISEFLTESFDV